MPDQTTPEQPNRDNPFKRGPGRPKGSKSGTGKPGPSASSAAAPAATGGPKKDLSVGTGFLYGIAGSVIEQRGVAGVDADGHPVRYPALAGRLMQHQSPVAGRELSNWIRSHDAIYKVAAPFLGASEFKLLSKVFGPPILIHIMQTRPESVGMLRPMVLPMLRDMFLDLKRAQVQERKALQSVTEMLGEDADAFEEWLTALGFGDAPVEPMAYEPEPGEPEPDDVAATNGHDPDGDVDVDSIIGPETHGVDAQIA